LKRKTWRRKSHEPGPVKSEEEGKSQAVWMLWRRPKKKTLSVTPGLKRGRTPKGAFIARQRRKEGNIYAGLSNNNKQKEGSVEKE